jgi:DNA polymerase-3 subunit gamma/tau
MIEIVDTLVRNGHHLQHFVRELARYFRNLLVTKLAGANERLVPVSEQERGRLAEIAASFSEQDLTRYLQLTLDLFRDLQFSLQPRLHLELGLIRLVEAGKLVAIEEALANAGSASPSPAAPLKQSRPSAAAIPASAPAAPAAPAARPAPASSRAGGLKEQLGAALHELGMAFTADAVEHSQLEESDKELRFITPAEFSLSMQPADLQKAVQHLNIGTRRITVTVGAAAAATEPTAAAPARPAQDEATARALAHPEVQRFQETFPGAEVRVVRNLKE